MTENILAKRLFSSKMSVKTRTLAVLLAIAAAVALPQLCHLCGSAAGLGTSLGELFLPMHLPIILVGILAGSAAGLIAGAAAPLLSFALTGMPLAAALPFMMTELAVYGLAAGMLSNVKMPVIAKVLITQAAGRLVRTAAVLLAVNAFGAQDLQASAIWSAVIAGLPGLIIQWCVIPAVVYLVESRSKNEL